LDRGGECIGLERDPALVAAATEQSKGAPVRFKEGDATQIPFADKTFDFVFARYLLMHLSAPETAIREMLRVVRDGGAVMLMEPDFSFQACHPPSWAYDRIPSLLAALIPDPFIGRKLVHMLGAAGAREVHTDATSSIEYGKCDGRRTWRMSFEAMSPGLLTRGILTSPEYADLIAEFGRVEQDPDTVLLHNPIVCAWAFA
jgi:SAM-dependent methyltransferase